MSKVNENLNKVNYFKDLDCQRIHHASFIQEMRECMICKHKNRPLYKECLQHHYGKEDAKQYPSPQQKKFIQTDLDIYDNRNPEGQRKLHKDILEENEGLKSRNWTLRQTVLDLELRFNRTMFNRYPGVVVKYAKEIMIWKDILHKAIKDGMKLAQKEGTKQFEFFYATNAKRVSRHYGISYPKALEYIKRYDEMGAWRELTTSRDTETGGWITAYYLGKRKRNAGDFLIDTVEFRLSNPKTKEFFDREKKTIT